MTTTNTPLMSEEHGTTSYYWAEPAAGVEYPWVDGWTTDHAGPVLACTTPDGRHLYIRLPAPMSK